jgi:RNA polymerase primary sigma factor
MQYSFLEDSSLQSSNYDSLGRYLNWVARFKIPSKLEEQELLRKIKSGNREARDKFIKSNLRLVISIAKKIRKNCQCNVPLIDIIQYGNEGLIEATNRYNLNKLDSKTKRPYRFTTYAAWWIKQKIFRGLIDNEAHIRIPVHMSEKINKYHKIRDKLKVKYSFEPPTKTIAKYMKVSEEKIKEIKKYESLINIISLESRVYHGEDGELLLKDVLEDKNSIVPYRRHVFDYLREYVLNTLKEMTKAHKRNRKVSKRDIEIFIFKTGLNNGCMQRTLKEVGEKYKLSRERIRQITDKVRKELEKKIPKSYFFS